MLILIAESKTMTACDRPVDGEVYRSHRPAFEDNANEIMASLSGLSVSELASDAKLSSSMAVKLVRMIHEFPDKTLGAAAIEAFTGVVFKAFDYKTLGDDSRLSTDSRVRIISSLYGWLRPDDIVKPYRLDFTTPLAPDGESFAAYWRPKVTERLIEYLQTTDTQHILNLLPTDAARCIDWRKLTGCAKVLKADFKELQPGGKERTPNAGRLKTLRGRLLRQIIENDITTPESLAELACDDYMVSRTDPDSGNIVFISTP